MPETLNGRVLFRKVEPAPPREGCWLRYMPDGCWGVSNSDNKNLNNSFGVAFSVSAELSLPTDPSPWKAVMDGKLKLQATLHVAELDPSPLPTPAPPLAAPRRPAGELRSLSSMLRHLEPSPSSRVGTIPPAINARLPRELREFIAESGACVAYRAVALARCLGVEQLTLEAILDRWLVACLRRLPPPRRLPLFLFVRDCLPTLSDRPGAHELRAALGKIEFLAPAPARLNADPAAAAFREAAAAGFAHTHTSADVLREGSAPGSSKEAAVLALSVASGLAPGGANVETKGSTPSPSSLALMPAGSVWSSAASLFDPRVEILVALFGRERVFPGPDFRSASWLRLLVALGMHARVSGDVVLLCAQRLHQESALAALAPAASLSSALLGDPLLAPTPEPLAGADEAAAAAAVRAQELVWASACLWSYAWTHFAELSHPALWKAVAKLACVPGTFRGVGVLAPFRDFVLFEDRALAFSQLPVLREHLRPPKSLFPALLLASPPADSVVLAHLRHVGLTPPEFWVKGRRDFPEELHPLTPQSACGGVLAWLATAWARLGPQAQTELKQLPLVPVGARWLKASRLFVRMGSGDGDIPPFLFEIPRAFASHDAVLSLLGSRPTPSRGDYLWFLHDLRGEAHAKGNHPLNVNELQAVLRILALLARSTSTPAAADHGPARPREPPLLLPTDAGELKPATTVLVDDVGPGVSRRLDRKRVSFAHPLVAPGLALALGVRALSQALTETLLRVSGVGGRPDDCQPAAREKGREGDRDRGVAAAPGPGTLASLSAHGSLQAQLESRLHAPDFARAVVRLFQDQLRRDITAAGGVGGFASSGSGSGSGSTDPWASRPSLSIRPSLGLPAPEVVQRALQTLSLRLVAELHTRLWLVPADPRAGHSTPVDVTLPGHTPALSFVERQEQKGGSYEGVGSAVLLLVAGHRCAPPLLLAHALVEHVFPGLFPPALGRLRNVAPLAAILSMPGGLVAAARPGSGGDSPASDPSADVDELLDELSVLRADPSELSRGDPGGPLVEPDRACLELNPLRTALPGEVVAVRNDDGGFRYGRIVSAAEASSGGAGGVEGLGSVLSVDVGSGEPLQLPTTQVYSFKSQVPVSAAAAVTVGGSARGGAGGIDMLSDGSGGVEFSRLQRSLETRQFPTAEPAHPRPPFHPGSSTNSSGNGPLQLETGSNLLKTPGAAADGKDKPGSASAEVDSSRDAGYVMAALTGLLGQVISRVMRVISLATRHSARVFIHESKM